MVGLLMKLRQSVLRLTHNVDISTGFGVSTGPHRPQNRKESFRSYCHRCGRIPEDIPALVTHFVEIFCRRMDKQIEHIPPETIFALSSYPW